MNIEKVRKELEDYIAQYADKEHPIIFEARVKELRDLLSNLDGERRLGREEGLELGRKEVFAEKMLKEGLDIEMVIKLTGLTKEEIQKLDNED